MDYDILPPTNDFVFKLLFGDNRHKSILIDMLKSFVDLPDEEFELVFLDTYLKPEHEEDKMGILDVKVSTKTGNIVDIEIQALSEISDNTSNPIRNIIRVVFIRSIGGKDLGENCSDNKSRQKMRHE